MGIKCDTKKKIFPCLCSGLEFLLEFNVNVDDLDCWCELGTVD